MSANVSSGEEIKGLHFRTVSLLNALQYCNRVCVSAQMSRSGHVSGIDLQVAAKLCDQQVKRQGVEQRHYHLESVVGCH